MGLYVNDVAMTKKEICTFLNIAQSLIPSTRRKVIEVNTRKVDQDKVRPPKSIGGKPEYLIHVPHLEREVKIRFATSQRRANDKDDNNFVYPFPKTLALHPAEDGTVLIKDEMEFLFWFLRPMCLQSPFHVAGSAHFYAFQDNDARATAEMDREEKYINAISIIVGNNSWNDTQLKHLAKGLSIQGVDDMTPMVVKQELKKMAHKDPTGFFNKANSREILFSGKIQEAIDRKIITLGTHLGMQRWYLKKNGKDEEFLPISYGQDPLTELKNKMSAEWYLWQDQIQRELDGVNIASNLENAVNDEAFSLEPKAPKVLVKAELTKEQMDLLREIKEKDWLEAKMKKIASYNLDDPKLMASQRKSYEDNKHYFEAWKIAKAIEEQEMANS